jgi:hypothetical protein
LKAHRFPFPITTEYTVKFRGFLYWLARLLGDVNAVKRGKVGRRIARRATGRATGGIFRKLFK